MCFPTCSLTAPPRWSKFLSQRRQAAVGSAAARNTFLRRWVDACSLKILDTVIHSILLLFLSPSFPPSVLVHWLLGFSWGGFSVAVTDSWCRLVDYFFFRVAIGVNPFLKHSLTHKLYSFYPHVFLPVPTGYYPVKIWWVYLRRGASTQDWLRGGIILSAHYCGTCCNLWCFIPRWCFYVSQLNHQVFYQVSNQCSAWDVTDTVELGIVKENLKKNSWRRNPQISIWRNAFQMI